MGCAPPCSSAKIMTTGDAAKQRFVRLLPEPPFAAIAMGGARWPRQKTFCLMSLAFDFFTFWTFPASFMPDTSCLVRRDACFALMLRTSGQPGVCSSCFVPHASYLRAARGMLFMLYLMLRTSGQPGV